MSLSELEKCVRVETMGTCSHNGIVNLPEAAIPLDFAINFMTGTVWRLLRC